MIRELLRIDYYDCLIGIFIQDLNNTPELIRNTILLQLFSKKNAIKPIFNALDRFPEAIQSALLPLKEVVYPKEISELNWYDTYKAVFYDWLSYSRIILTLLSNEDFKVEPEIAKKVLEYILEPETLDRILEAPELREYLTEGGLSIWTSRKFDPQIIATAKKMLERFL